MALQRRQRPITLIEASMIHRQDVTLIISLPGIRVCTARHIDGQGAGRSGFHLKTGESCGMAYRQVNTFKARCVCRAIEVDIQPLFG